VFVKICGITNEADALMATAMGADAVGFIFAPSTRRIQPTVARDIARRLPPEVLTVGVFRDESPQRVVEMVNTAGLRAAQLHGFESPAEVAWVRKRVPVVFKAFAVGHPFAARIDEFEVDAIVLDAAEPGSGVPFAWSGDHAAPRHPRVIVAGGLRPDNVHDAIAAMRPWGVDVATGVESAPGHKDVRLTRAFINTAKWAGGTTYWDDPDDPAHTLGGPLGALTVGADLGWPADGSVASPPEPAAFEPDRSAVGAATAGDAPVPFDWEGEGTPGGSAGSG
jgi:phosphoribosylanthranilate isomerase